MGREGRTSSVVICRGFALAFTHLCTARANPELPRSSSCPAHDLLLHVAHADRRTPIGLVVCRWISQHPHAD